MPEGFGERLRLQRERQQIDLTAIAEQTKIKRSLLEALERDDVSQWPSGIFRRAWFRTYAQAIGMDAEAAVREFLEIHPDPESIPVAPSAEPVPGAPDAAAGIRGLVGAAFANFSRRVRGNGAGEPAAVPDPSPGIIASPQAVEIPADVPPVPTVLPPASSEFDLSAIARLCTSFGQAGSAKDVQPLLQEVASMLDATGLIVWLWHSTAGVLRPALVHGYSAGVVARLPPVTRDADNPTAAAFRSAQVREVEGGSTCGALVIPLLLRSRCVGVLALELEPGRRLTESARAVATILAAAVAQLVNRSQVPEALAASSPRLPRLSSVHDAVS